MNTILLILIFIIGVEVGATLALAWVNKKAIAHNLQLHDQLDAVNKEIKGLLNE